MLARDREDTSKVMDCVKNEKIQQDERAFSKNAKHETSDKEDEVHGDLICDIPDEDSILLVQFQGSDKSKSQNSKLVKSFSLTKERNERKKLTFLKN